MDGDSESQGGYAVALSADGTTLAVGRRYHSTVWRRSGEVQVYRRTDWDSEWAQLGQVLRGRNENDQLGYSLSLSFDGGVLAASEIGFDGEAGDRAGNVRAFRLNVTLGWESLGGQVEGEAPTSLFGVSVSLSSDGTMMAVGAPYHNGGGTADSQMKNSGRVRVFALVAGVWEAVGGPLDGHGPYDWYGWSVSLSSDGKYLATGAPGNSEFGGYVDVHVWDEEGESWVRIGDYITTAVSSSAQLVQSDAKFGHSVSMVVRPDFPPEVAVGAPYADSPEGVSAVGRAEVFWLVAPPGETYDKDVAATAAITAPTWEGVGSPLFGSDENSKFGWAVSLSASGGGWRLGVGSPGAAFPIPVKGDEGEEALTGPGMVLIYELLDGSSHLESAQPMYGDARNDDFGFALALSGDGNALAVGAPGRNGGSRGNVKAFNWT